MVRDRGDSGNFRQRIWGVPIPIYYCEAGMSTSSTMILSKHYKKKVAVEGSDAWWAHSKRIIARRFQMSSLRS